MILTDLVTITKLLSVIYVILRRSRENLQASINDYCSMV